MRFLFVKQGLLGCLLAGPTLAFAQTARDLTEISMDLDQQAHDPRRLAKLNADLANAPAAFLVVDLLPGRLWLADGRWVTVSGARYNVAARLVQTVDSARHTNLFPVGSIRGFELGRGANLRRFETRLVRNPSQQRNFVEMLSKSPTGPVLLAAEHRYLHQDEELHPILRTVVRPAVDQVVYDVVASPTANPQDALRPLPLNSRAVLRLFGPDAAAMQAYATAQRLDLTQLADVLTLANYYNAQATR